MPPLATRIHTSVIHLTASHRNDPPVTCSESPGPSPLLPACFLSVAYTLLSLSFSSYGAQQHTERRLTVSLPRPSKKREESIFRYRQLLLTGERPQRQAFFIHVGGKEAPVLGFFCSQPVLPATLYKKGQASIGGPTPWVFSVPAPVFPAHIRIHSFATNHQRVK